MKETLLKLLNIIRFNFFNIGAGMTSAKNSVLLTMDMFN